MNEKYKTKAQMMWEVSKEQEDNFKHAILETYPSNIVEEIDIDELFKLIRGAEYRRGKEDGEKAGQLSSTEKCSRCCGGSDDKKYICWTCHLILNEIERKSEQERCLKDEIEFLKSLEGKDFQEKGLSKKEMITLICKRDINLKRELQKLTQKVKETKE